MLRVRHARLVVVIAMFVEPEAAVMKQSSADVGKLAPLSPPSVADQHFVSDQTFVQVPPVPVPTTYRLPTASAE